MAHPTNPDELDLGLDTEPALTQQEIWDDSSLVEAWDEALSEYKVAGPRPSAKSQRTFDFSASTSMPAMSSETRLVDFDACACLFEWSARTRRLAR